MVPKGPFFLHIFDLIDILSQSYPKKKQSAKEFFMHSFVFLYDVKGKQALPSDENLILGVRSFK